MRRERDTTPEMVLRTEPVVRRAPFSDNPVVGIRGQRTRRRILEAALSTFASAGYHQSIESITQAAGCSRATFYQYFSSKEDVFRHLAGRVARQLDAATDWLEPITPDADGWTALRGWIGRYAEIYDRHEPIFRSVQAATESDPAMASELVQTSQRHATQIRNRIEGTDLAPRELEPVIDLFLRCIVRTLDALSMLGAVAPESFPREAALDALADVTHRTLFGVVPDVNLHQTSLPAPPRLVFGQRMQAALDAVSSADAASQRDGPTRDALRRAGRRLLVSRGYDGTSIDAVIEAAGVSRGAFYHHFENKEQLVRELAVAALESVAATMPSIPVGIDGGAPSAAALRRWLRRYDRAQADEAAMIRVWVDAALHDDELRSESAAVLDWGRRRMAHFLRNRGFGGIELDAVVLLALLEGLHVAGGPPSVLDGAVRIIERGFLGR